MATKNKISQEKIQRIRSMEEKCGIEDINLFVWKESKEALVVYGEIFGEKLKEEFKMVCSVYNDDGDIIASAENDSYSSGLVTSYIEPVCFKCIFPFSISIDIPKGETIGKIRIYPQK